MPALPDLGLHASALRRLAAGAVCCAIAIALVWWVERPREQLPNAVPVTAPMAPRSVRLVVESSYPVARWSVRVLAAEQRAEASDPWSWHGLVVAPAGEDVVVTAVAAPGAAAPHRSLRLRLGDGAERIVWGAGDMVVAEPVR